MLRAALGLVALVTFAPALTTAGPREDLDAALADANAGRCAEALARARAIAEADRAFYADHVPAEPRIAACRIAVAKAESTAKQASLTMRRADAGANKAAQIAIATGAGALAWFGGAYLGSRWDCCGGSDDEGLPGGGVMLGATIATVLTSTTVVYVAGRDDNHDDSVVTTAFGAVGGGALGIMLGVPMIAHESWVMGIGAMIVAPAVGATIGFHLGRSAKKRGLEIMPTASSGFTGAVLGGRF